MMTIFAARKIVAASIKASASSARVSRFPAVDSGVARVPSKFRRANAGTGSEQQGNVRMQVDR